MSLITSRSAQLSLVQKFWQINWGLLILLTAVASIGFAMLYSAAGGDLQPWAIRQMVRFSIGLEAVEDLIADCEQALAALG